MMPRIRARCAGALVAAAVLFAWAVVLGAAAAAAPPKEADFDDVVNAIMSPVCPGKLLANCPSAEGAQLRELVRRKIFAGETKEQIIQYFVDVYGRSVVLPKPPAEGFFLTAWLLPIGALVSGFAVVFVLVRAWSSKPRGAGQGRGAPSTPGGPAGAAADEPLESRLKRELDEFGG